MKQLMFFLIAFLGAQTAAISCSCFGETDFCSTLLRHSGSGPYIILGKKLDSYHYGMHVETLQEIEGSDQRDTLLVWGDNGALCRVYADEFDIGDTIILALEVCDLSGNFISTGFPDSLEDSSHYQLSVCGQYFLRFSGGTVFGSIKNQVSSMPYRQFLDEYRICAHASIEESLAKPVNIYFDQDLNRLCWNSEQHVDRVEIFDTVGKRMVEPYRGDGTNAIQLHLPSGLYFARISQHAHSISLPFFIN